LVRASVAVAQPASPRFDPELLPELPPELELADPELLPDPLPLHTDA